MSEKLSSGPKATYDLARTGSGLSRGPNLCKKTTPAAWSNTWPAPGATLDLDFANDRGFVRGVGQGSSMQAVTFTRASNGNYVKSDGTLSSHANQGALGNNLLTFPQDFDNAAWAKTALTVTANAEIAPDGTLTADLVVPTTASSDHFFNSAANISFVSGTNYTYTIYAKQNGYRWLRLAFNGGAFPVSNRGAWFDLQNGVVGTVQSGVNTNIQDAGNGWYRCTISRDATSTASVFSPFTTFTTNDNGSTIFTGDGISGFYLWGAQLEVGSSATTYYPTNINVPRFDWASTASTGAGTIASPYVIPLTANPTCNGLLIEESRANRLLWCRDASNAAWTKTNVNAVKDQTGIDGVASAASSLTASADNGTCIQTITLASGSRTASVYLKRITGSGNVQATLDGSTWSTVDLSNGLWNRIVISGTVTNPTVGIRIATNGDAVAMDYGQIEDGAFATSPILTTTASVTRSADAASMSGSNFLSWWEQGKGTSITSFQSFGGYSSQARIGICINAASTASNVIIQNSTTLRILSTSVIDLTVPTTINTPITIANSFQSNNYTAYATNSSVGKSLNGSIPFVTSVSIGSFQGGANFLNGTTKRIIYTPKVIFDDGLKDLVSAT